MPLPPKRPADLPTLMVASLAPLPPVRPAEFGALPPPKPQPNAGRVDAIAGLIGTFDPTPPRPPKPRPLPAIITQWTAVQASAAAPGVMSYAPDPSPFGRSVVQAKSTAITPPRPPLRTASVKKPDLTPARLDRSNFRTLTASTPVARMTSQSALGGAVAPLRPAARVDARALVFSTDATPARFEAWKGAPATDRFAGSALESPLAQNDRLNDLLPPASIPN